MMGTRKGVKTAVTPATLQSDGDGLMRASIGVVRDWQLARFEGEAGTMKAASLVKLVIGHLALANTRFDEPEPGFHGFRPLLTTGADFGRFVAHVLGLDDERWRPQWRIDAELAWGAGWGLEVGPPLFGWQWGANPDAANFVIGCPATGEGVVIFTDREDGRTFYREVVERVLPGDHPSLRVERNPTWNRLFAQ